MTNESETTPIAAERKRLSTVAMQRKVRSDRARRRRQRKRSRAFQARAALFAFWLVVLVPALASAEVVVAPSVATTVACWAENVSAEPIGLWIDLVDAETGETVGGLDCFQNHPMPPGAFCQYNGGGPWMRHPDDRYACLFRTDAAADAIRVFRFPEPSPTVAP